MRVTHMATPLQPARSQTLLVMAAAVAIAVGLTGCEPGTSCSTAPAAPLPVAADTTGTPPQAQPARGETIVDEVHNTCITRMTDREADDERFIRNDYSRRQAFNVDDSRMIVYVGGGSWRQLDVATGADLGRLPGPVGDAEPQWHPTNPNLLYYIPDFGGLELLQLNVVTGQTTTVGDFAGRLPWPDATRLWTGSEGSPSADARWWGFMAQTANGTPRGFVVWDRANDAITTFNEPDEANYVSMSPTGDYFVAGYENGPVVAFTRTFDNSVEIAAQGEHSDLTLLANGNDAYVALDFESNGGPVQYTDIAAAMASGTSSPVTLFETYLGNGRFTSIHFSGKAYDRPGWVLASTYNSGSNTTDAWYTRRLLAIELVPDGRVLGLAHHHGDVSEYFDEPHASVNRDFTKAVFNSDWGTGGGVDTYLIDDIDWIADQPR